MKTGQSRSRPARKFRAGFTLIELMVTLAILAILTGLAAPSVSTMIANQRAKSLATDLYISLTKARSEALKRNTNILVAPSTAGQWQAGWTIKIPSTPPVTLDVRGATANVTVTGPVSVTFRSSGRVLATSAPSFDITVSGTTSHWCVSVDLSGRPYTQTQSSACSA